MISFILGTLFGAVLAAFVILFWLRWQDIKFYFTEQVDQGGYKDSTKFIIEVRMRERWISHFLAMLKEMQYLGAVGSSRQLTFFADGDGDFRPSFKWDPGLPCDAEPIKNDCGHKYYDAG